MFYANWIIKGSTVCFQPCYLVYINASSLCAKQKHNVLIEIKNGIEFYKNLNEDMYMSTSQIIKP